MLIMYLQPQVLKRASMDAWQILHRPCCLSGVHHCIKAPDFSLHLLPVTLFWHVALDRNKQSLLVGFHHGICNQTAE